MSVFAELHDGRKLEFPDGTDPSIIQRTVKKVLGVQPQGADAIPVEPGANTTPTPAPPDTTPAWGRENPNLYSAAQTARKYLGPLLSGGGAVAGGVIGSALGPAGTVGGAGLGYGIGESINKAADVALGNTPPETAQQALLRGTKDVLTGATMEAGGQVVAPLLSKGLGKAAGYIADLNQIPTQKAAEIARNALGPDLPEALNALRAAPGGITAGQATADITSPTWQALIDRALKRDPRFLDLLKQSQGEVSLNALADLAGGGTQTAAKGAQIASGNALRANLIPTLNTELNAANTAGTMKPVLDAQAQRMAEAAAAKVADVRRFTAASERAPDVAASILTARGTPLTPLTPIGYTYAGELGKKAEQVATQAADASLPFGEASKFAQAASDSLAAHGLKPLETAPIISKIEGIASNPEFAGNDIIAATVKQLSSDLAKWTNSGGVIDAYALNALRQNSVNAAVQQMRPTLDATAQKKLAASVIGQIKPSIVSAIESAGGTGYGSYLEDYAKGSQEIAQQKLAAKALELFKTSPDKFKALVNGDNIKEVENIFGPGSYDLAKEMSTKSMGGLQKVAQGLATDARVAEQSAGGQDALRQLLMSNMTKMRLPSYLSVASSTTNKALDLIENRIGTATMNRLTDAMKSGSSAADLLDVLPASDRVKVLSVLSHPEDWMPVSASGPLGVVASQVNSRNRLAPKNQNALAP